MRNKIFMLIVVAVILVGGYVVFGKQNASELKMESEAMFANEGDKMEQEGKNMEGKDEMMKNDAMTDKTEMMSEFDGQVLAGRSAPLLDFNQADYEKARASDKLIVVYFYANWCPICRAEFPVMQEVFNELETDKVVGFRINFNDNETDDSERELAREHGVAYQHTKVFLKNGKRVLKSPETWDKERYIEEINKAL